MLVTNIETTKKKIKKYLNPIITHDLNKEIRYEKLENFLENYEFDDILYRLILEHNTDYNEKFTHNGKNVELNNKFKFLLSYVIDNTDVVGIKKFKLSENCLVWKYNKYFFQIILTENNIRCRVFTSKYKKIFEL
jgi:hypothetical protein